MGALFDTGTPRAAGNPTGEAVASDALASLLFNLLGAAIDVEIGSSIAVHLAFELSSQMRLTGS